MSHGDFEWACHLLVLNIVYVIVTWLVEWACHQQGLCKCYMGDWVACHQHCLCICYMGDWVSLSSTLFMYTLHGGWLNKPVLNIVYVNDTWVIE
jgi:hypothetical protein